MERIEPIRPDRSVRSVDLARLTPLEREQEKERREQQRRRRAAAGPQPRRGDGGSGLDVRV
jgi:hypothetical protein